MQRRDFLKRSAAGLGLLAAGPMVAAKAATATATKPNVLFLAVDDWNDWMGCLGDNQAKSPNLDKLAARGVAFRDAHCTASYCTPSRTAIMTGMHPTRSGSYTDQPFMYTHPDNTPIPLCFKKNGYTVAGGGKVYHHMPGYLDLRGFDEHYHWNPAQKKKGWGVLSWIDNPATPKGPLSESCKAMGNTNFDFGALPNEDEAKMADTMTADWAVKFLQRKHDKPFFLCYGAYAPHKPNFAPQKYFDLYPLKDIQLPEIKRDDLDDLPPMPKRVRTNRKKKQHDKIVEVKEWKKAVQAYLASLSYADAQMGKVLDALDKSGHAGNTIVLLWSDNGYHLGEKFQWGKHTYWQRTTHIPFIWAGPGIPKDKPCDKPVGLIDIYPTLVEMCGLKLKQKLDGKSLCEFFDPAANPKPRFVLNSGHNTHAVVSEQYRYIQYSDGNCELYDRKADPNEWTNLAIHKKKYAAILDQMKSHIPANLAKPAASRDRDGLVLKFEGETFQWVKGKTPPGGRPKKRGPKKRKPKQTK